MIIFENHNNSFKMTKVLVSLILIVSLLACKSPNKEPLETIDFKKSQLSGEQLAKNHCARCHPFPEPQTLPKSYWEDVLPIMGHFFGKRVKGKVISDENNPNSKKRLIEAGIFPQTEILSDDEWNAINQYYLQQAPDFAPLVEIPTTKPPVSQFKVEPIQLKEKGDGLTYIHFDNNKFSLGFNQEKQSYHLKTAIKGNTISKIETPSPLVDIVTNAGMDFLLTMGNMMNIDNPTGSILFKTDALRQLIGTLERPADFKIDDFNNDGVSDILVAEFGKYLGGINLYTKKNGIQKTNIHNKPGATKFVVKDVNNDGLKDFYCLVAQEDESVYLFINTGGFKFKSQRLFQLPPYYGTTHFDVLDFDNDGDDDIICSSGDLGDFSMGANNYHGVRIFENLGNSTYKQAWFYNQQGAYGTVCVDFDKDGDIDIASIGYEHHSLYKNQEGFVYFENQSDKNNKWKFKPHTIPNYQDGCFLLIKAEDIDYDGDTDILLGSNAYFLNDTDRKTTTENWANEGGMLTILRNNLIP
jgi:hypothetical protein